jgi:hypothetical protein
MDGLANFVRDNKSQMMLSAMADKIQQNAKEVTATKDTLDRAETRYDDLEIRHSMAGSEEKKITIAVVMKKSESHHGNVRG